MGPLRRLEPEWLQCPRYPTVLTTSGSGHTARRGLPGPHAAPRSSSGPPRVQIHSTAVAPGCLEREAGGFELEEKQSRYTCGTVPVEAGTGQDTDTPRVSRWSTCSPYPFHSLRPPAPSDVRSMLSPPGMWQLIASATGNNITCPYFACL